MIVYGDHPETARTVDVVATLTRLHGEVLAQPPGIARHAALSALFVELGRLIQGVADARSEAGGEYGPDDDVSRLMAHAASLGRALMRSWDSDFADEGPLPPLPPLAAAPGTVTLKQPEGYAFYALYPESYALAARQLRLDGPPRVIGIRSIGTALAALVAATLAAPTAATVRPVGHPFDRHLATAPAVSLNTWPRPHFVIVDEGPGLSGSSFAACAGFLEERGIPRPRIAFMPSHVHGPGSMARRDTRVLWHEVQKAACPTETFLSPDRVARWVEGVLGPLEAPLTPISGGRWRTVTGQESWPADPPREALKFIARAKGQLWLVKFAGLGLSGHRKLERARRLAAAGLVPEPVGLAYGFLVQRWVETRAGPPPTVTEVAHYLAARRRILPPPPYQGASPAALFEMARVNIGEALGADAAGFYEQHFAVGDFRPSPAAIDGRMDSVEWLRRPDGSLMKADALDHDCDHDLIGPQDLAWDVAGAGVELGLDEDRLVEALAAAGSSIDAGLLRFLMPCYLAYRIGHSERAAQSAACDDDRASHAARLGRYGQRLRRVLYGRDDRGRPDPA